MASPASVRTLPAFVPRTFGGLFFGWWVVVAGAGLSMLGSALFTQAYGAYVVLLQDQFGWSRTALSAAFGLGQAEGGIAGPFQGRLIDRYGPRAVAMVGVIIFGAGMILIGFSNSLPWFFGAVLLTFVGVNFAGFVPVTVAVANWFQRRRSRAIAFVSTGFAIGGLIVPATVLCLETFGWRPTAIGSGFVVWGLGIPFAMILLHRPGDYGFQPDGAAAPLPGSVPATIEGHATRDFTLGEAVRTPQFWLIAMGHGSALLVVSAVMVHLVPHINESRGYSLAVASLAVAVLTFCQATGNLVGGILGDRFSKRWIAAVCMLVHAGAILTLAFGANLAILLLATAAHGLAWGTRGPLMMAIRADYFGLTHYGSIVGASQPVVMLGMTTGPIVAGILYDTTGNYQAGFAVLATLATLGALTWVFCPRPGESLAGSLRRGKV